MQLNTNLPKHNYTNIIIWPNFQGNKSHVRDQSFKFWKSEVGSQNSELRSRKSEVGSRKSEVGSRKSKLRGQNSEVPPQLSYRSLPDFCYLYCMNPLFRGYDVRTNQKKNDAQKDA